MSVPKPAPSRGSEFGDPLQFPVSCYVQEFAPYTDASRFTDMRASDNEMPIRHYLNVLRDTDVGACCKSWLHCAGRGMFVSRSVGSEVNCLYVCCYEEVNHEKYLSTLVQRFEGRPLHKIGPSLVVLRRSFSHFYFAERFDYWLRDYDFDLHLRCQACEIFAGWHKVECFGIPPSHRPSHYIENPGWWQELKGSHLLCVSTPRALLIAMCMF